MNHFEPKPITPEYLLKKDFQQMGDTSYHLRIENGNMTALILSVDIIRPAIGYMVGIRNERDGKYSILPIETEKQLNKLINALQGK